MKLGVRNYVRDPTTTSKYGSDRAAWGVSAHARNITVCDFLFFLFFVFSPRLQVATVDRFSRSIRQTTRFRARKCLLGVSMTNFHIYPPFLPKIWKFALRPMATLNGNNSAIFEDRRKLFAPKWGFSGSGNLMASSKFPSDRPLLPW